MLAAWLGDVLIRDPDPAVLLGVGDHPLDQRTTGLLGVGSAGNLRLSLGKTVGESISDPLQLTDPKDPRPTRGAHLPIDPAAREGGGEKVHEFALQAGYLTPQLIPGDAVGGRPGGRVRGGDSSECLDSRLPWRFEFEKFAHLRGPFQVADLRIVAVVPPARDRQAVAMKLSQNPRLPTWSWASSGCAGL